MDSLGALNAFVQAADARSFTEAATQLGVSPSAVGKAIARLEERLSVRLFHRSTRSITLTPEGTLFLERCRRIFGEIEAAEAELVQSQEAPRGKLRVSLPMAGMLLMPTLTAFMRAYPEVEIDLDFSDRMVDVIEEGFDAVVRSGEIGDSRLMTRQLGTFHPYLVASPAYFAKHGMPATPQDLDHHHCLHHRFPSTGKLEPWPLVQDGAALNVVVPVTAVSNALEPLIHMAEEGLGIACLPDFTVRRQMREGALVSVLENRLRRCGTYRILWPSSRHLSPKLRVFVDFMAANLFPANGGASEPV
ncbi:LysR substrate-binding domain-containing protein [Ensifer sp. LC163]|uniref:LysR substrate-binding domain-containing protein n=1 Tax=Ensifer sp. LC163 TaxID=1120652 RepID=UPI0008131946|nr:LysR substrate-binding domain-containing protein [Ensifer sp. LC163]OCP38269.1 LysR family transcriptional regulator [Ensifer sp. LC163]